VIVLGLVEIFFTGAITGVFAGFCSGIGTYFSNKLVIKHLDRIEERLKKKV
jgi:ascorbate-specific PTS system EIIC-type component UlaA